jgi:hypothetical protein
VGVKAAEAGNTLSGGKPLAFKAYLAQTMIEDAHENRSFLRGPYMYRCTARRRSSSR